MSNQDPPAETTSLFPDAWIVGRAAAKLVRDDEDVLLAGDPAPTRPDPVLHRDIGSKPRAPSLQELAELRAEMDRLQQRISLHQASRSQCRLRSAPHDAGAVGAFDERRPEGAMHPGPAGAQSASTAAVAVRDRRRLRPGLVVLLVAVLATAAAVGYFVYRQTSSMPPPLGQRLQLFKQDVTLHVVTLGDRLKALRAGIAQ